MKRIEVFPEIEEARGKPIDGEKLEEFLKNAKTDWVFKMMAGNVSPDDKFPTLCMVCQKLFNELEELKSKPKRNCDVGNDWLEDFYCHFKPPKGMREMPPEWVDAITEFCKWLVLPVNSKMED